MQYLSHEITASGVEYLRGTLTDGRELAFRRCLAARGSWELQHRCSFGTRALARWRPADRYQHTIIRRLLAQRDQTIH